MAQVEEGLLSKCEVLNSIPNTAQKKKSALSNSEVYF
jgi:hypothetical protein